MKLSTSTTGTANFKRRALPRTKANLTPETNVDGGAGKDTFFYALGNGNDTISGATDGDVINLAGVTLEQITSTEIAQGSVTINFADGGSLIVDSNTNAVYQLADDSKFSANHRHFCNVYFARFYD